MNNTLYIPEHVGLARHADYTGNSESQTRLTDLSLAFLKDNVQKLAERLEGYQRLVLFHSPKLRTLLSANVFREVFKRKGFKVDVNLMKILDVGRREFTRKSMEDEVEFAEEEGTKSFYLFITHEPVIEFFFKQQNPELLRTPVQVCEIITKDFTIAGHFSH